MWCSDPALDFLKQSGYNVVRLPKADIKPLEILTRQAKSLERLGKLSTLLMSGKNVALPAISKDKVAANVSGTRSGNLSFGIGLSILSSVLAAMGGSTLGIDAQYSQAKSITFEFYDVLEDSVEVAKLDQYLTDADINAASHHVANLLESDAVYVTTATIKSRKFGVEAQTENGTSLAVSVPAIQGVVGGEVKVTQQGAGSNQVAYKGKVPLVFGFQAVRLFYDAGRYTAFRPVDGVALAVERAVKKDVRIAEPLESDGPFLRLKG